MENEEKLQALKELFAFQISALQKLLDERFDALAMAQKLEAKELSRRMELLNNEGKRIKEIQDACVRNDVYTLNLTHLTRDIDELESWRDTFAGKISAWAVIFAIITSLIVTIIGLAISRLL